jgi:lipoprotein|nr:copper resistance protein NlpE [uncultured Capnocytophaga sp.]
MKKIFLLAGVAMLFSCNQTTQNQNTDNSSGADTEQKTSTQSDEYVGTYKGMFPCADCSGINVLITLNESTYTSEETAEDIVTKDKGSVSYDKENKIITLISSEEKDRKTSYKVKENTIVFLEDGKEIEGELASYYILTKQ